MSLAVGIDIGGTGIKYSLVTEVGEVRRRHYHPLQRGVAYSELLSEMAGTVASLAADASDKIIGIGLATPGHIERIGYTFVDGGENLPALGEGRIVPDLADATDLPVAIENDGLAAAMGEMMFGAGQGVENFAMLTLGTGVGGGLICGGRPNHGPGRQPPEFGAIVLDIAGPPNTHGQPGTLEAFAGKAGFAAAFARQGLIGDDLRAHFALAGQGHEPAVRAVDAVALRIAQAIGIITNIANIEICIIGGGVSGAGPVLFEAIERHLPHYTWPALYPNVRIVSAKNGNDAGTLGAAALAFDANAQPG
ncbi:sugar kinase [Devosia pacifica]|uniref:Sugar kinase n=1 Tax=Devosia pacifica TaxID=1335967 RepID=A0A918SDE9_9HYPH|nr:ROK family protein [Devosia pacifica]GHA35851.1 sugar kinase [Devosia pacifica]